MSLEYAVNGHVAVLTMRHTSTDPADAEWADVERKFTQPYQRGRSFMWLIDVRGFSVEVVLARLDTVRATVRASRWRSARRCVGLCILADDDLAELLNAVLARISMMHKPVIVSSADAAAAVVLDRLQRSLFFRARPGESTWRNEMPYRKLALLANAFITAANPPIM
uniref:Uncharacterized protein n=1 Tax=viral metagenome TaxID=1070528 RepID=A0A6C0AT81_9ZZZZ